jgi:hypothetical protein
MIEADGVYGACSIVKTTQYDESFLNIEDFTNFSMTIDRIK